MSSCRHDLCDEVATIAQTHIHTGHRLRLFRNAEEIIPALLVRAETAARRVWIEIYTIRQGRLEAQIVDSLARAAVRGVDIRILADGVGSRTLPRDFVHTLGRRGIAFSFFRSSITPSGWQRNHRKLVLIDNTSAFTGGLSIDDVFLGARCDAEWRETMVEIEGPVLADVEQTFIADWHATTRESLTSQYVAERGRTSDVDAQLVASTRHVPSIEACITSALRRARIRVFATTPYFVPLGKLATELGAAAERGVDVRVLVPGAYHTVPIVKAASRASFGSLLKRGVRIFEYNLSMVHAKTMVIDGGWSTIGSANLDQLSLRFNREANIVTCAANIAADLERYFLDDIAQSTEITLGSWERRKWRDRTGELFVKPFRWVL